MATRTGTVLCFTYTWAVATGRMLLTQERKDSERTPPEREWKTPASPRARSCQSAVTNAPPLRVTPTRRPHPPPGGGRCAALRSRSSRTAAWERHLRRASVQGSAARRCTPVSAAPCAPLRPSVPLPLADPQTEAPSKDFKGNWPPRRRIGTHCAQAANDCASLSEDGRNSGLASVLGGSGGGTGRLGGGAVGTNKTGHTKTGWRVRRLRLNLPLKIHA